MAPTWTALRDSGSQPALSESGPWGSPRLPGAAVCTVSGRDLRPDVWADGAVLSSGSSILGETDHPVGSPASRGRGWGAGRWCSLPPRRSEACLASGLFWRLRKSLGLLSGGSSSACLRWEVLWAPGVALGCTAGSPAAGPRPLGTTCCLRGGSASHVEPHGPARQVASPGGQEWPIVPIPARVTG